MLSEQLAESQARPLHAEPPHVEPSTTDVEMVMCSVCKASVVPASSEVSAKAEQKSTTTKPDTKAVAVRVKDSEVGSGQICKTETFKEKDSKGLAPMVDSVVPDELPDLEDSSEAEEEIDLDDLDQSNRCAVCGLTLEESDILVRDTGEYLGELFACDGNCGYKYHVKCAGVIGDAGQYSLPEGEWFCTLCTASIIDGAGGGLSSGLEEDMEDSVHNTVIDINSMEIEEEDDNELVGLGSNAADDQKLGMC